MKKYVIVYWDKDRKDFYPSEPKTRKEIIEIIKEDNDPKYYHHFEIKRIYEVTGELNVNDFVKGNEYIIYFDSRSPQSVKTTPKEIKRIFEEDYLGDIVRINKSSWKNGKRIEKTILEK